MALTCNPSTLGGRGRQIMRSRDRDHPGQHGETLSLLKIQKLGWAWWRVPLMPSTQEAEAGELPEPGGRGCGEPRSRHCTPAWVTRAKLRLKKKKKILSGFSHIVWSLKFHYSNGISRSSIIWSLSTYPTSSESILLFFFAALHVYTHIQILHSLEYDKVSSVVRFPFI